VSNIERDKNVRLHLVLCVLHFKKLGAIDVDLYQLLVLLLSVLLYDSRNLIDLIKILT